MYSRNRSSAEVRYADYIPPVYGGSRFYRGAPSPPQEIRGEEIRPAVPDGGIPVQYEARPQRPPRGDSPSGAECPEECAVPACPSPEEDPCGEEACPAEPPEEACGEGGGRKGKEGRHEGLLPALLGDPEEILLIVLLLLLTGEQERSSDMIFILLLLMIVR